MRFSSVSTHPLYSNTLIKMHDVENNNVMNSADYQRNVQPFFHTSNYPDNNSKQKNSSWITDDDAWNSFFGIVLCLLFVFLLVFVLWYPFNYYTGNDDINRNGIPDHRENYRYYHSYYYWPNY